MNKNRCKQRERVNGSSFPLALAVSGDKVRIVEIKSGTRMKERLLSMGLRTNDTVEVIQSRGKNALLLAKDENRFMLGGGMAQKIFVTKT